MAILENVVFQFAPPVWFWAEAKPGSAELREHRHSVGMLSAL